MHDVPYIQNEHIGPEVIASMARVSAEIKQILPNTPCGVQVLASANYQALAVAKAANLQFIRAEGFVFSHVADEGFTDACAGQLLRYRKQIDAENVLIFTDLKKKHSSHSITNDVSLLEVWIIYIFKSYPWMPNQELIINIFVWFLILADRSCSWILLDWRRHSDRYKISFCVPKEERKYFK